MGVPAFFRWLTLKYPESIKPVLESRSTSLDSENASGEEYDNLVRLS